MRRIIAAVIFIAGILASATVSARDYGNGGLGISAGLTTSNAKVKELNTKDISLYHAGITYQASLGAGFSIQPSLLYQVKGMRLSDMGDNTISDITGSLDLKAGYIELPVQLQWGPDLLLMRPYGFVEPFIGYLVNNNNSSLSDGLKKVDYGLSLGAGIEIWKLQVSGKWFWNFGGIYGSDVNATTQTMKTLSDGNNFNGFALSVSFFF